MRVENDDSVFMNSSFGRDRTESVADHAGSYTTIRYRNNKFRVTPSSFPSSCNQTKPREGDRYLCRSLHARARTPGEQVREWTGGFDSFFVGVDAGDAGCGPAAGERPQDGIASRRSGVISRWR